MEGRVKGVYKRKDGRFQARYKKGIAPDGRAVYGVVYGKSADEVIEKRRAIVGDEEVSRKPANELNLLILGAGSFGKDIKELAENLRIFRKIAFLDDDEAEISDGLILGKCKDALRFRSEYPCAFVAMGDNKKRKKYAKFLKESNFLIPSIISSAANISSRARIGEGVAIMPRATVGDAEIGDFCIIASNSVVNSEATLKSFVHVDCSAVIPKRKILKEGTNVSMGTIYGMENTDIELMEPEWIRKHREQFGTDPNLFDGA